MAICDKVYCTRLFHPRWTSSLLERFNFKCRMSRVPVLLALLSSSSWMDGQVFSSCSILDTYTEPLREAFLLSHIPFLPRQCHRNLTTTGAYILLLTICPISSTCTVSWLVGKFFKMLTPDPRLLACDVTSVQFPGANSTSACKCIASYTIITSNNLNVQSIS